MERVPFEYLSSSSVDRLKFEETCWYAAHLMGWRASTLDGAAVMLGPNGTEGVVRYPAEYKFVGMDQWQFLGHMLTWVDSIDGLVDLTRDIPNGCRATITFDNRDFLSYANSGIGTDYPFVLAKALIKYKKYLESGAEVARARRAAEVVD